MSASSSTYRRVEGGYIFTLAQFELEMKKSGGAKASRRKVQCTLCKDIFDNDYLSRHTASKNPELKNEQQLARTCEPGGIMMRSPWDIPPSKKLRKTAATDETICVSAPLSPTAYEHQQTHLEEELMHESMYHPDLITSQNEEDTNTDMELICEHEGKEIEDEDLESSDDDNDPANLQITVASEIADGSFPSSHGKASFLEKYPLDISKSPADGASQPRNVNFPKHMIASVYRSFNPHFYDNFQWIEYSVSRDAIYCFPCRHSGCATNSAFSQEAGFRTWNKCYGKDPKDNRLLQHQLSNAHVQAVETCEQKKQIASGDKSVLCMSSEAHRKLVSDNRHYMRTLCEVLLHTAQRKSAQRECSTSNLDSDTQGNFLSLLHLIAKYDLITAERIRTCPKNAKYTHHSVQNALLDIMADMTLRQIRDEIEKAGFFTLLADESKDMSKKKQVAIAVRYIFEGCVHEELIALTEAYSLDAKGLADTILKSLEKLGLKIENCVGQGYDGAGVVSGHLNGINAIIRRVAPLAVNVPFFSHRLNLVIVDTVKGVPCASRTISLLQRLYVFVSGSNVHAKWVSLQEERNVRVLQLKSISDTRWACQAAMLSAICKRMEIIVILLSGIAINDKNSDRAMDAAGLLHQINEGFLRILYALRYIMEQCKRASDFLENPSNDLSDATDIIQNLRDNLNACRSQEQCLEFWSEAEEASKKLQLEKEITDFVNTSRSVNTFEDFQREIYAIIDTVLSELNRCFGETNITLMRGISGLTPGSPCFLQAEVILPFADIFQADKDGLAIEIENCKRLLARKGEDDSPTSLIQFQQYIRRLKDAFYQLDRILTIACTLPVSTCECERSFSTLRIIKNHLRTTMSNDRLNNLMILGVHKSRSASLDLNDVVNAFAARYPRCRILLS